MCALSAEFGDLLRERDHDDDDCPKEVDKHETIFEIISKTFSLTYLFKANQHPLNNMEGPKRSRLNIDVDDLANRRVKRRKKRDLNETIYYEINGKKVPIFTPEFLEENRIIEGELRKLRKLNNDYEEHNSVLIRYIESLNEACDQVCDELKELTQFKDSFSAQLNLLKTEVKEKYGLSLEDT